MNIKLIFLDGNTLSKKCHNKVTLPFSKTTYTVLPTPPFLCKNSKAPFFGELGKPLIPPPSLWEIFEYIFRLHTLSLFRKFSFYIIIDFSFHVGCYKSSLDPVCMEKRARYQCKNTFHVSSEKDCLILVILATL